MIPGNGHSRPADKKEGGATIESSLAFDVFSVKLAFRLELDHLRVTACENGLILHKTPDVSANQKGALRMFRFENSDNRLAAQRFRFSDASI
jgi:hypothetical protein